MCRNFMIGTSTPALAGIWAKLDDGHGQHHPDPSGAGPITFNPDDAADCDRFIAWVSRFIPADKQHPKSIVKVAGRGMTDTDYPSVSIMNTASHAAVADAMGQPLRPSVGAVISGWTVWPHGLNGIGLAARSGLVAPFCVSANRSCVANTPPRTPRAANEMRTPLRRCAIIGNIRTLASMPK